MGIILLAAFIVLPLIEIWVFIEIGAEIGAFSTIAVCVLTAVVGMAMLRVQGFATLMRARGQMDEGILPAKELFDGLCLLVAGAFLLTPGFVTDIFGFLLLVPAFRDFLRALVGRRLETHATVHVGPELGGGGGGGAAAPRRGPRGGTVIEGEFEEVDPGDHKPDADAPDANCGDGRDDPPRRPRQ
jgi:UPF0716 protein FxsA